MASVMRRTSAQQTALLVVVAALAVAFGLRGAGVASAQGDFGQNDPRWLAYYANPSEQSTWEPFCQGDGAHALVGVPVAACGPTNTGMRIHLTADGKHNDPNGFTDGFQCVELA